MLFKDAKWIKWDDLVQENQGWTGRTILETAKKWAEEIEKRIGTGEDFSMIAKFTEKEIVSSNYDITGHMFDQIVKVLVHCWQYGDKLAKVYWND
jgi:hypothetical protein